MVPLSDVNLKGKVPVGLNLEGKKHPRSDWCWQTNYDQYLCVCVCTSVFMVLWFRSRWWMFQWAECRSVHKTLQSLFLVFYCPPSFPVYPFPVAEIPFLFAHLLPFRVSSCRLSPPKFHLSLHCSRPRLSVIKWTSYYFRATRKFLSVLTIKWNTSGVTVREVVMGEKLSWKDTEERTLLLKQAIGSLHGNDS